MQRGQVLFEAAGKVINGERQTSYGDPEDSFAWIAERWNQYLKGRYNANFELKPEDATFMMMDFKMARECNQHKKDNIIDLTGYAGITYDMINSSDQAQETAVEPYIEANRGSLVAGSLGKTLKGGVV